MKRRCLQLLIQLTKHLWLMLALLLSSGCDNRELVELTQYIQRIKSRPSKPIEPIPTLRQYSAFSYPTKTRRNPFAPYISESALSKAPDINRPKQPLEQFPLDALQMVGVIEHDGKRWGIVEGPDGLVYKVSSGDFIGKQYGKVTAITTQKIEITELISVHGGWENRPASLALSE